MNPFLETAGILAVNFSPTDLYLEPSQIPDGYTRAAERLGVQMLPHTFVSGIVLSGEAEHGTIRCEIVVDAAGAWLRAVAALTGASVPMVPTRHQLMITEPIWREAGQREQPTDIGVRDALLFRETGDRLRAAALDPPSASMRANESRDFSTLFEGQSVY